MALSTPLRSLSTAVRILRDEGPGGILVTLRRMATAAKKQRDFDAILEHETLLDRFAEIDRRRYWFSPRNKETRSGTGSTRALTRAYVKNLSSFLDQFKNKYHGRMILLDAPCGHFNWIKPIATRDDLSYIGADIVPSIVEENSRKYKSPNIRFMELDITADRFPDATFWHCRDCLIHLSFANIRRSFERFAQSRVDYAMITCAYLADDRENMDIVDGDFRSLDFRKPPFILPRPVHVIPDAYLIFPRFTHVYTRDQIAGWLT